MNSYANIGDIKTIGGMNIEGVDSDPILMRLVVGLSEQANLHVNRHFYSVTETRYFDGTGGTKLSVPDLVKLGSGSLKESTSMDGTWDYVWGAQGTDWV